MQQYTTVNNNTNNNNTDDILRRIFAYVLTKSISKMDLVQLELTKLENNTFIYTKHHRPIICYNIDANKLKDFHCQQLNQGWQAPFKQCMETAKTYRKLLELCRRAITNNELYQPKHRRHYLNRAVDINLCLSSPCFVVDSAFSFAHLLHLQTPRHSGKHPTFFPASLHISPPPLSIYVSHLITQDIIIGK